MMPAYLCDEFWEPSKEGLFLLSWAYMLFAIKARLIFAYRKMILLGIFLLNKLLQSHGTFKWDILNTQMGHLEYYKSSFKRTF